MLVPVRKPSRKITSVNRQNDALILKSEHSVFRVAPKTKNIIRLTTHPKEISDHKGIGIGYDEAYANWSHEESDALIKLSTEALILEVNKATGSITYKDKVGNLLLAERGFESRTMDEFESYVTVDDGSAVVEDIVTADGVKKQLRGGNKVFDKHLYKTRWHLQFQEGEALYGLGQKEEGTLNLRGTTQYLHQANLKIPIPLLLSTKGYGLLLGSDSTAIFNDTAYGSYFYTEADVQMDHYFIAGNFDEIVKGYRLLSGKAQMLPKWAFGYIQSQERYETADEIVATLKEYRRREIGLDCIVLDWRSWEDGLWGQKTFDKSRFPDPTDMVNQIHEQNARFMLSLWPMMDENSDNYKEFKAAGHLLPGHTMYNPFKKEGRDLYWKQVSEGLFTHGIDSWWCDSSEPFTPEWTQREKPEASVLYNQYVNEAGSFVQKEVTNAYSYVHALALYEGQRSERHDKRVTNLTRSGHTGQQKYGTILWSGDIYASWYTLRNQIVEGLNLCASGMPYWTLDIGAFFVGEGDMWYWGGKYNDGHEDLGFRELYTRWYQYAAFLPVFRSHGTEIRREMWKFGDKGEVFYDSMVKANQLRYQLIPYIYSTAASVWHSDGTMMKLLAFDFADDSEVYNISDQYMFGDALMVCPITEPMLYDVGSTKISNPKTTKEIYLPKGSSWYDFYTNERFEGGQWITVDLDIARLPVFVKAGSIVPMGPVIQHVNEQPDAPVTLKVYPGADASFKFYHDDGDTYDYENGKYTLVEIKWCEASQEVSYEMIHRHDEIKLPEFVVEVI